MTLYVYSTSPDMIPGLFYITRIHSREEAYAEIVNFFNVNDMKSNSTSVFTGRTYYNDRVYNGEHILFNDRYIFLIMLLDSRAEGVLDHTSEEAKELPEYVHYMEVKEGVCH